jgi:hypothetical protein
VRALGIYIAILLIYFKGLKDVTRYVNDVLKQRLSSRDYEEAISVLNDFVKLIEREQLGKEFIEELEFQLCRIFRGSLYTFIRADSIKNAINTKRKVFHALLSLSMNAVNKTRMGSFYIVLNHDDLTSKEGYLYLKKFGVSFKEFSGLGLFIMVMP